MHFFLSVIVNSMGLSESTRIPVNYELIIAACPAMCAAIGGAMWLSRRFSKGKNQAQIQQPVVNSKEEAVEVKTESIDRNQQHLTYEQKRRKDKAAAQDTYAISD
jgi:hypothetical protein